MAKDLAEFLVSECLDTVIGVKNHLPTLLQWSTFSTDFKFCVDICFILFMASVCVCVCVRGYFEMSSGAM